MGQPTISYPQLREGIADQDVDSQLDALSGWFDHAAEGESDEERIKLGIQHAEARQQIAFDAFADKVLEGAANDLTADEANSMVQERFNVFRDFRRDGLAPIDPREETGELDMLAGFGDTVENNERLRVNVNRVGSGRYNMLPGTTQEQYNQVIERLDETQPEWREKWGERTPGVVPFTERGRFHDMEEARSRVFSLENKEMLKLADTMMESIPEEGDFDWKGFGKNLGAKEDFARIRKKPGIDFGTFEVEVGEDDDQRIEEFTIPMEDRFSQRKVNNRLVDGVKDAVMKDITTLEKRDLFIDMFKDGGAPQARDHFEAIFGRQTKHLGGIGKAYIRALDGVTEFGSSMQTGIGGILQGASDLTAGNAFVNMVVDNTVGQLGRGLESAGEENAYLAPMEETGTAGWLNRQMFNVGAQLVTQISSGGLARAAGAGKYGQALAWGTPMAAQVGGNVYLDAIDHHMANGAGFDEARAKAGLEAVATTTTTLLFESIAGKVMMGSADELLGDARKLLQQANRKMASRVTVGMLRNAGAEGLTEMAQAVGEITFEELLRDNGVLGREFEALNQLAGGDLKGLQKSRIAAGGVLGGLAGGGFGLPMSAAEQVAINNAGAKVLNGSQLNDSMEGALFDAEKRGGDELDFNSETIEHNGHQIANPDQIVPVYAIESDVVIGYTVADPNFHTLVDATFDTREEAEQWAGQRYQQDVAGAMRESMLDRGYTEKEADATLNIIDALFGRAAEAHPFLRKDDIYKQIGYRDIAMGTEANVGREGRKGGTGVSGVAGVDPTLPETDTTVEAEDRKTLGQDAAKLFKAVGDPEENLRLRNARRPETGVAKNGAQRFDRDGKPIYVGADTASGGKSFAAWVEENEEWFTPEEIAQAANWYDELLPEFEKRFGKRKGVRMMVAWLASQQNESPSGGVRNIFRVADQMAGLESDLKGGLADENLRAILQGKAPEKGLGAKLLDFLDAGTGSDTRTYMGNDPSAGKPFVADVHTGRDSGHVDQQTLTRLKKFSDEGRLTVGGQPVTAEVLKTASTTVDGKEKIVPVTTKFTWEGGETTLETDQSGSPSGNNYEGISDWGNRLTNHLNETGWMGRNDWEPKHAQAIGWMRVLRQYELEEGSVGHSFDTNTYRISSEFQQELGGSQVYGGDEFGSLDTNTRRKITTDSVTKAAKDLAKMVAPAAILGGTRAGIGYWMGSTAPNVNMWVTGSDEAAGMLETALGFVTEQQETSRVRFGRGGAKSQAIWLKGMNAADAQKLADFIEGERTTKDDEGELLAKDRRAMVQRIKGAGTQIMPGQDGVVLYGLGPKTADAAEAVIQRFSDKKSIPVDMQRMSAEVSKHENKWKDDPTGSSYKDDFVRRGGSEALWRSVVDYRRVYAGHLEDVYAKHAPGTLDPAGRDARVEHYANFTKRTVLGQEELGGRGQGSDPAADRGTGSSGVGTEARARPTPDGGTTLPGYPSQLAGHNGGNPQLVAVAEQYAADNGIDLKRQDHYVKVNRQFATNIANAYEAMEDNPNDPVVREAYENLIEQTRAQHDALVEAGYNFTFYDGDSDPYAGSPQAAMRDLRENKSMAVYGTYDGYGTDGITATAVEGNPMLQDTGLRWPDQSGVEHAVTANDLFRAVHDAFGHGLEGAGFRARGEENAWQAHIRLFTGSAQAAMTTETRGQNSWLNYGPYGEQNRTANVFDTVFAENKINLLPEWTWTERRAGDMDSTLGQEDQKPREAMEGQSPRRRGQIEQAADAASVLITAFEGADPSTFVHEAVHALDLLGLLEPALGEYADGFFNWATEGGIHDRYSTATHERIAEGMEQFLKEGRPPKNRPDLQAPFARLKSLLDRIYHAIKDVIQLTPEARRGYEQLFDPIRAAEPQGPITTSEGGTKPLMTPKTTDTTQDWRDRRRAAIDALPSKLGQPDNQRIVLFQGDDPETPIPAHVRKAAGELAAYHIHQMQKAGEDTFEEFAARYKQDTDIFNDGELKWIYSISSKANLNHKYSGMERVKALKRQGAANVPVADLKTLAIQQIGELHSNTGARKDLKKIRKEVGKATTQLEMTRIVRKLEALTNRVARENFRAATKDYRTALMAYRNGVKNGKKAAKEISQGFGRFARKYLGANPNISGSDKKVINRAIGLMERAAAGKARLNDTIDYLENAEKVMEDRSARAELMAMQARMVGERVGERRGISDLQARKKEVVDQINEDLKTVPELNKGEVKSLLAAVRDAKNEQSFNRSIDRVAKAFDRARSRAAYKAAETRHDRAKTNFRRWKFGNQSPAVRDFLAINPKEVPSDMLPAYTMILDALSQGGAEISAAVSVREATGFVQDYTERMEQEAMLDQAFGEEDAAEPNPTGIDPEKELAKMIEREARLDWLSDELGSAPVNIPQEAMPWWEIITNAERWQLDMLDDATLRNMENMLDNAEGGLVTPFMAKVARAIDRGTKAAAANPNMDGVVRRELRLAPDATIDEVEHASGIENRIWGLSWLWGHLAPTRGRGIAVDADGRIRSRKLERVGQMNFDDALQSGDMINKLFSAPLSRQNQKSQNETGDYSKRIRDKMRKLEGSGRGLSPRMESARKAHKGLWSNSSKIDRREWSNYMIGAALLQREFEANGGEGNWIIQEIQRLKHGDQGTTASTFTPQQLGLKLAVAEALQKLTGNDLSFANIEKLMTPEQKNTIAEMDKEFAKTGQRVYYAQMMNRGGEPLTMYNAYFPHRVQTNRDPGVEENINEPVGDQFSTRSSASFERIFDENGNNVVQPVSWDAWGVSEDAVAEANQDYYLTHAAKVIGGVFDDLRKGRADSEKRVITAIENAMAGHIRGMKHWTSRDVTTRTAIRTLTKQKIFGSVLSSIWKVPSEAMGAVMLFSAQLGAPFGKNLAKMGSRQFRDDWNNLWGDLGAAIRHRAGGGSRELAEARMTTEVGRLFREGDWELNERGFLGFLLTNKFSQGARALNRLMTVAGDLPNSRAAWITVFDKTFKNATGEEFSMSKYKEGGYSQDNDALQSIQDAAAEAEQFVDQMVAPSDHHKTALALQADPQRAGATDFWGRTALFALTSFNRAQMIQFQKDIGNVMTNGLNNRSRAQSLGLIMGMTAQNVVYMTMMLGLKNLVAHLFSGGEDDEAVEKLDDLQNAVMRPFSGDGAEYWIRSVAKSVKDQFVGGQDVITKSMVDTMLDFPNKAITEWVKGDYNGWTDSMGFNSFHRELSEGKLDSQSMSKFLGILTTPAREVEGALDAALGLDRAAEDNAIARIEGEDPNKFWGRVDLANTLFHFLGMDTPFYATIDAALDSKTRATAPGKEMARAKFRLREEWERRADLSARGGNPEKFQSWITDELPTKRGYEQTMQEHAQRAYDKAAVIYDAYDTDVALGLRDIGRISDGERKAQLLLKSYEKEAAAGHEDEFFKLVKSMKEQRHNTYLKEKGSDFWKVLEDHDTFPMNKLYPVGRSRPKRPSRPSRPRRP